MAEMIMGEVPLVAGLEHWALKGDVRLFIWEKNVFRQFHIGVRLFLCMGLRGVHNQHLI